MNFLQVLNPGQRQAVGADPGPVLVLAGPGSGKTRVLTYRVGYLVHAFDVAPWQIMAVTFTNKAAQEMKERLSSDQTPSTAQPMLTGRQLNALTIGTFHSVCARILRREIEAMSGWDANFVIYDTDDQKALVRQALSDLDLDEKKNRPAAILGTISRAKNELKSPEHFEAQTYAEEVASRVYERYQQLLRQNNAFDFDDLLMKTVQLFGRHESMLARYQERYQHILVDEFQDTNLVQYQLVKMLAGGHHHLFVVGDEDQSIYSWRGADYRNVERFRRDFPEHQLILLEQNYRSTGVIVGAAKGVIRQNLHRVDKELFTDRGDGDKLRVIEVYDEQEEAQYVVGEIAHLEAAAGRPSRHCAIMYRTNAQSRVLEESFVRRGMPYHLVRGTRFYERKEIKDAIAYLRLAHNPRDGVALDRVINTPPRGIGKTTIDHLHAWAFKMEVSVFDALLKLREEEEGAVLALPSPFAARARKSLLKFIDILLKLLEARGRESLSELFDTMLSLSGYRDYVSDGSKEADDRWENLMELGRVTQEFAGVEPSEALTLFLERVALVSDSDGLTDGRSGPALLTLHTAKGLEFPVVFVVGMDEGVLPHQRSLHSDDPEEMEEERRLCYVGITRAMDQLYLVHTFRRRTFGMDEISQPSRFLQDIPDQLVDGKVPVTKKKARRSQGATMSSSSSGRVSFRSGDKRKSSTLDRDRHSGGTFQARFGLGDIVVHAKFGEGTVVGSHLTGDDQEVEVAFPDQGIKRLSAAIAPMEKKES